MDMAIEPARMTSVDTTRFGTVTFSPDDVIEFPWGLPGFADLRSFLALSLTEQPDFVWLQSIEDPKVALPMADPWRIFADYEPRLPAYATETLELRSPEDFTILCVVVVTKGAEEMTMNLLAPVVINLKTNRGRQVMLENSTYPVKAAIPRRGVGAQGQAKSA